MTDLKEMIERELESFIEWPTDDKSHVATTSAKLFAEHVAGLWADHVAGADKMVTAVQGEPVGEVRFELGAPSSIFAELYSKSLPVLAPGTKLYTTPQPAPDVSGMVEALTELCDEIDKHEIHSAISKTNISWFKRKARAALAQGQGET